MLTLQLKPRIRWSNLAFPRVSGPNVRTENRKTAAMVMRSRVTMVLKKIKTACFLDTIVITRRVQFSVGHIKNVRKVCFYLQQASFEVEFSRVNGCKNTFNMIIFVNLFQILSIL